MSDIFQEVEEEVRKEQYEQLWKKYGNYFVAAAAVLVVAVAGYQLWKGYEQRVREQISDRFRAAEQLVQANDAAKAEVEFAALAKDASGGYATLAKFHLAGVYLAEGKRDQAVALLRELIGTADPVVSSSARLRLAWTIADAVPRTQITEILQPLMAADNPWRFAAGEVTAYLTLKEGARMDAQTQYEKLAQEADAPASLKQRASAIAQYLKANPNALPVNLSAGGIVATPAVAPAPAPAATPAPTTPASARGAARSTTPPSPGQGPNQR